jgi:hypothetical protein
MNRKPEKHKKNASRSANRDSHLIATPLLTAFSLIIACLAGYYAWLQINSYEKGVAEIYAVEQDGYVQLVLDQINLQEDRTDDEIIKNILATLDSSTNHYWTLTHDEALVFVKDILETSRYKSFSTDTYYNTTSSQEFIRGLKDNVVTHAIVKIGNKDFIASGVKFTYNNKEYQICLLTNAQIMLENNTYLSTKINLVIMIVVILSVFIITTVILSMTAGRLQTRLTHERDTSVELRNTIESLSERLEERELYDSRTLIFSDKMIPVIFTKLEERNVRPVSMVRISLDDGAGDRLADEGQTLLAKSVIRMKPDDSHMILIFIGSSINTALRQVRSILRLGIHIDKYSENSDNSVPLSSTFAEIRN